MRHIASLIAMGSPFFRFKRFTVWHDRCAMKVGTDGVLLGAWCELPEVETQCMHVLDIGTGSGLIALMLAQRLEQNRQRFKIYAIDIEPSAVEQSRINFEQSPWALHLSAKNSSMQEFYDDEGFDLIVSNPPYFQNSLKNPDKSRATARHTDTLTYAELLAHAKRLLKSDGRLSLILPIEAETEILKLAKINKLTPTHITYVHSKEGKPTKRILISMRSTISECSKLTISHFYIESAISSRSKEYSELTKEFYL